MYTVRKIDFEEFQIAKWEDRKEPEAVYTVRNSRCSCPASYRSKTCKHKKLVSEYLKTSEISFYEISGTQVKSTPIALLG